MNRIDRKIRAKAQKLTFKLPKDYDAFLGDVFKKLDDNKGSGKKMFLRKNIRMFIIAAALVISLTASAVAMSDVHSWLVTYFTEKTDSQLAESQVEILEKTTTELESSDTCNGITITAQSVTGDDHVVYVKLKIESQPGITLKGKDLSFFWGAVYLADLDNKRVTSSCSFKMLNDETSTNNCAYMLLTLRGRPEPDGGPTLSSSCNKVLGLTDLYNSSEDGFNEVYREGTWKIKLPYSSQSNSIELISESVEVYGNTLQIGKVRAKMTTFVLSSYGATCEYEILDNAPDQALDFVNVMAYMKDGTSVRLIPGRAGIGHAEFQFEAPVSLEEVAYIQFGENTRLQCQR